jgi:hypothetical protein
VMLFVPRARELQGVHKISHGCGTVLHKTIIKGSLPEHIARLGGHQAPVTGTVTNGVQLAPPASAYTSSAEHATTAGSKREREGEEAGGKVPSEKETKERALREAARQRVQARTASSFGLG